MTFEDIYNIIDEEPLDLPFKKALLALVLEVEALQRLQEKLTDEKDKGSF
jgi:hypothetical protein